MTFVGINLICIREHGINILSLFLPPGSSMVLALLLVPIELVSYIFRPISLSVRLFANMMAGHTLLKVIAGFAWTMMLAGGGLLIAHTIPLAKHLSNGGQIFAFEPQSQNYKLLLDNIKENEIKNVKIAKLALSSVEGNAFMNKFDDKKTSNYGDARIFKDKSENFE